MSRLTEKEIDYLIINGEYSKDADRLIREAAHELREYRKLEEQGRLIELPCAVGTRTYFVVERNGKLEIDTYRLDYLVSILNHIDDIGKWLYLTKEEAEAKLAELKGE